ncbi:MAG: hypothetical protein AAF268_16375 [Cyanobacteria bacterium P01_A01_bin.3]
MTTEFTNQTVPVIGDSSDIGQAIANFHSIGESQSVQRKPAQDVNERDPPQKPATTNCSLQSTFLTTTY